MTQVSPASPAPPASQASPAQLAWLERELADWVAADLVSAEAGVTIRGRYTAVRTFSLTRLVLALGSAFVGVGLIWLVAANLDRLSPSLRFGSLTLIWLALTATAELLADRGGRTLLVGAFRAMSALAFGAVVFQAAQSLQVPAYEPSLLAVWGAGALIYAYAARGVAPLMVGLSATTAWFIWQVVESSESVLAGVLAVLAAGAFATGVAALHQESRPAFGNTWRVAGAGLMLAGLFVAALPDVDHGEFVWTRTLVAGVVAAGLVCAAALVLARRWHRLEVLVPLVAAPVGVLLVLWDPPLPDNGVASGEAWVSAFVSVAVYVLAAGAVAVVGALRDAPVLTVIATGALVIFTVTQSFAVFAPVVSGAALFLLLGVILIATGFLFDRARREVATTIEESLS